MLEGESNDHEEFPWVFVIAGISFSVAFLANKVLFGGHSHPENPTEVENKTGKQPEETKLLQKSAPLKIEIRQVSFTFWNKLMIRRAL